MAKINARSTYNVNVTDPDLIGATLEIEIYSGEVKVTLDNILYTLRATAINNSVTFKINELLEDYFESDVNINGVLWLNYRVTQTLTTSNVVDPIVSGIRVFDGYDYFLENQNVEGLVLMTARDIYIPSDNIGAWNIPIDTNVATELTAYDNIGPQVTVPVSSSTNTSGQVLYYGAQTIVKVEVTDGVTTDTININTLAECKYTPYKVEFINKFGAKQYLYFFKNSKEVLSVKNEEYKRYGIANEHQLKRYNIVGNESITLNSGFYPESYNDTFKELFLSKEVFFVDLEDTDVKTPVNIKSKSLSYKTQLTDKLINYSIDFDYAFDLINNTI